MKIEHLIIPHNIYNRAHKTTPAHDQMTDTWCVMLVRNCIGKANKMEPPLTDTIGAITFTVSVIKVFLFRGLKS